MHKRIFFAGQYFGEGGPAIVNRNLVAYLPRYITRLHYKNRYIMRIETLLKIIWCRTLILSALGHKNYEIKLAKFLGCKLIYIMHGFGEDDGEFVHNMETYLLPKVDLILCVSFPFCELAKCRFPQFAGKMKVLTNGVAWDDIEHETSKYDCERDDNEIVLIGGGRRIKQNLNVCRAIQSLNESKNLSLHVSVYGLYNENDDSPAIKALSCVTYHGVIPHTELMRKYKSSRLLIQNSVLESFGLAIIEALIGGCDILVGKATGVLDIMKDVKTSDLIQDYSNIDEIKNKILYVLEHSNNKRLLNSIDKDTTSLKHAADCLIRYATQL